MNVSNLHASSLHLQRLLTGVGACLLSGALFLASFAYRDLDGGEGDPGTLFMPRLVMGLAFAVGLWSCISAFLPRQETEERGIEDDDPVPAGIGWKPVVAILATAVYLMCFYWHGYFWATPLYLAFVLVLAGIRNWRTIVLIAGGFWLAAYFIFYRLLDVPFLAV